MGSLQSWIRWVMQAANHRQSEPQLYFPCISPCLNRICGRNSNPSKTGFRQYVYLIQMVKMPLGMHKSGLNQASAANIDSRKFRGIVFPASCESACASIARQSAASASRRRSPARHPRAIRCGWAEMSGGTHRWKRQTKFRAWPENAQQAGGDWDRW